MKTRFSANNLIAIMIAIALITVGFILWFINKQMEDAAEGDPALSEIALIHAEHDLLVIDPAIRTELERIDASIDWRGWTSCV